RRGSAWWCGRSAATCIGSGSAASTGAMLAVSAPACGCTAVSPLLGVLGGEAGAPSGGVGAAVASGCSGGPAAAAPFAACTPLGAVAPTGVNGTYVGDGFAAGGTGACGSALEPAIEPSTAGVSPLAWAAGSADVAGGVPTTTTTSSSCDSTLNGTLARKSATTRTTASGSRLNWLTRTRPTGPVANDCEPFFTAFVTPVRSTTKRSGFLRTNDFVCTAPSTSRTTRAASPAGSTSTRLSLSP